MIQIAEDRVCSAKDFLRSLVLFFDQWPELTDRSKNGVIRATDGPAEGLLQRRYVFEDLRRHAEEFQQTSKACRHFTRRIANNGRYDGRVHAKSLLFADNGAPYAFLRAITSERIAIGRAIRFSRGVSDRQTPVSKGVAE